MGGSGPKRVGTKTDEQMALINQILGGGGQAFPAGLQQIMAQIDPEMARQQFQTGVADPAIREFQGSVIPSILQSAANLGAKGGSSIERQLAGAGAGLERDLSEQFARFQAGQGQQGIQNLMALLGLGAGQETFAIQPAQPGPFQQLLGAGTSLGAAYLGGGEK